MAERWIVDCPFCDGDGHGWAPLHERGSEINWRDEPCPHCDDGRIEVVPAQQLHDAEAEKRRLRALLRDLIEVDETGDRIWLRNDPGPTAGRIYDTLSRADSSERSVSELPHLKHVRAMEAWLNGADVPCPICEADRVGLTIDAAFADQVAKVEEERDCALVRIEELLDKIEFADHIRRDRGASIESLEEAVADLAALVQPRTDSSGDKD